MRWRAPPARQRERSAVVVALTPKQQRFVSEYLLDLNATAAARRAGYSARNADKIGSQLLGKTRVQEAIEAAQQARSERTEVTADLVVAGLLREARLESDDSSHSARVSAWAHLGKHLGMFVDRTEMTFPEGLPFSPEQAELARQKVDEYRRQRTTSANGHNTNGQAQARPR